MSLLPLLIDINDEIDSSPFCRRNDFGFGILPSQILTETPRIGFFHKPRHFSLNRSNRSGKRAHRDESQVGKDGFQVCMDVQDFAPNEISVKTVDNSIVVEGSHEERPDEHADKRRYELPDGFNVKDVVSTLSSDGVLTVKAPPEAKFLKSDERVIQIQQTGPAHLSIGNKEKTQEPTEIKKKKRK